MDRPLIGALAGAAPVAGILRLTGSIIGVLPGHCHGRCPRPEQRSEPTPQAAFPVLSLIPTFAAQVQLALKARTPPGTYTGSSGHRVTPNTHTLIDPARSRAQKSGLSAFGISETDASNAMLFSAQMVSSIAPVRVR